MFIKVIETGGYELIEHIINTNFIVTYCDCIVRFVDGTSLILTSSSASRLEDCLLTCCKCAKYDEDERPDARDEDEESYDV